MDSPKGSIDQYGAISSDHELISVDARKSIVVYPRVDALLNTADQIAGLDSRSHQTVSDPGPGSI